MDEMSLTVVVATFDARPGCEGAVAAALARYVVMSRGTPGCRNIDLVASLTTEGRFVIYEKWGSADDQSAHLASPLTADMAATVTPLLARSPDLGLFEALSAHDLV
ncbi:MAG: putative quinol monooxygenase [Acidimicrobiia bacterium]